MRVLKILIIFLLSASAALPAAEKMIVRKVNDDGSLKVSRWSSIKLLGVTLPSGWTGGSFSEFYYDNSREALSSLVLGNEITVEFPKPKRGFPLGLFQRTRKAYVYADTIFINTRLLREGNARWDEKFDHRLAREFAEYEKTARKKRIGLWLSPFNAFESE